MITRHLTKYHVPLIVASEFVNRSSLRNENSKKLLTVNLSDKNERKKWRSGEKDGVMAEVVERRPLDLVTPDSSISHRCLCSSLRYPAAVALPLVQHYV